MERIIIRFLPRQLESLAKCDFVLNAAPVGHDDGSGFVACYRWEIRFWLWPCCPPCGKIFFYHSLRLRRGYLPDYDDRREIGAEDPVMVGPDGGEAEAPEPPETGTPEPFEGGATDTLLMSTVGGASEPSALTSTLTLSDEEPLEIKAKA